MRVLKKPQIYLKPVNKIFQFNFDADVKNYSSEYEMLFNSLFGLQFTNEDSDLVFTFGVKSQGDKTEFYAVVPDKYIEIFKKQYAAINPYIQLEEITDPLDDFSSTLIKNEIYRIDGYNMKLADKDPSKKLKMVDANKRFMSNLINNMNNTGTDAVSIMEVTIQPLLENKRESNFSFSKGLFTATNLTMKGIEAALDLIVTDGKIKEKEKQLSYLGEEKKGENEESANFSPQFYTSIRVMSKSTNVITVANNIKGMASVFADLTNGNSLIPIKAKYEDLINRNLKCRSILCSKEIIQFVHLPDKNVSSENIKSSNCRKLYDRDVPQKGLVFGDSNNAPIAFPAVPLSTETFTKLYKDLHKIVDNLVKPKLILGQQGTGKSEWIINYIHILIKLGISIILVDPKNDTQQRLIESLEHQYLSKLDYINLGDTVYPPAMNIFRKRHIDDPTENSLIVTSFISLMKKEFGRSWGFHIQRILQMTSETILLNDVCTLNEFEMMLNERTFREYMIEKMKIMLEDPDVKSKGHVKKLLKYWDRFNQNKDKDIAKEIEPVMNQIGVFLSNRIIKAIVSQKESYDFRKAADQGKIVIVNIPEGVLGDNTKLLASMINKAIWLDIQSRADVDIARRYPVAWIIDEAHEIVDDEFVGVLTKARAYRLGLTLVTQGLSNFKMRGMEDMRELILTNCKNKVVFRVGPFDARDLAEEFIPLTGNDLSNCPDYHFYAKILLEKGNVSDPFFGHAPDLVPKVRNYDEYVQKHRSGKFTVDQIEDELEDRLESINVMNALTKE